MISGLIALVLIIHLINLLRHRRVQWAAMEFLLRSYRRNRRRVQIKQWLLIATRTMLLLVALALFGQIGCRPDQTIQATIGTTHHVVLLDDSFSMQQIENGQSLFDRAIESLRSQD